MLIPTAENLWWALNLLLSFALIYYGLTSEHFFSMFKNKVYCTQMPNHMEKSKQNPEYLEYEMV